MRFADYQQGDKGQGVRDLQTNLKKVGYPFTTDAGKVTSIDGVFGAFTRAAVDHFQEVRRVTGDPRGVAGPGTLIALSQAIASRWKQTDFIFLGMPTVTEPTEPSAPPRVQPRALPFGLTPTKLGLLALLGIAAYASTRR